MSDAETEQALTRQDFDPLVGRTFHFEGEPAFAVVLERIETGPAAPEPYPESFLLIFAGQKPGPVLPEGLHTARTQDGKAFSLYVMPIHTTNPDRQEYQSPFG